MKLALFLRILFVRLTDLDIFLADFLCYTLFLRTPFHFRIYFWVVSVSGLCHDQKYRKTLVLGVQSQIFLCDPKIPDLPRPLDPQAIHEVKTIFLITQRHVSHVHCVVSCTDDIKATVGKAAGASHRSRQWHPAVLMAVVFITTAHWGF